MPDESSEDGLDRFLKNSYQDTELLELSYNIAKRVSAWLEAGIQKKRKSPRVTRIHPAHWSGTLRNALAQYRVCGDPEAQRSLQKYYLPVLPEYYEINHLLSCDCNQTDGWIVLVGEEQLRT
ncbi:hypothetical protein QAD02_022627 [Eretmocerus hayati]|uniref:Uncharacterized protein n=1 Tax=Eretmocerus hayati TaxID=131215 RepID=A0ACC2PV60_9HYME|nr:hypothetical protein QAD02_022627 [Eretmocerus hayati]